MKGSDCASGKMSMGGLTVALRVNAVGKFETPLVIGKAPKPHCFKSVNPRNLSVIWTANKKAWMTSTIFMDWISKFNWKMRAGKTCSAFSSQSSISPAIARVIKCLCAILPTCTTFVLQPLNLGIIINIKCHYHTQLLRAVFSKIVTTPIVVVIVKSTTVLDACHWIRVALSDVKAVTVERCFRRAGIK